MPTEYKNIDDIVADLKGLGDSGSARVTDVAKKMFELGSGLTTGLKSIADVVKELKQLHAEDRDRLEELEAKGKGPGRTANETRGNREHMELFTKWIKSPRDQRLNHMLTEVEAKTVTLASDAAGGHAVPEQISREVERLERQYSPVRELVSVVPVASGNYKELLTIGGATSGWVGEAGPRPETDTPLLREIAPTMGELYAYPQTTEWALDDAFFNVGNWLAEEVAREFATQLADAVIRGDASNKPTGMLHTTPVTTADFASPLRAAAAYECIECDTDAEGSPASPGILVDKLIDLVYTLNAAYRANARWIMNSKTAGTVMKLKDAEGRYIWSQSLVAGQPSLLLGYPVVIWEHLDDIAHNAFPLAFGDFRRGYCLTQRTELRITVDANITTPGRIKYFVRQRLGGIPRVNDAIKWLKTIQ